MLKRIELPLASHLYDEHGTVVGELARVFQAIAKDVEAEGAAEKRGTHVFEQPTFILTGLSLFPRVKINSVSMDVKIVHKHETRRAQMSTLGQWIFRNIKRGESRLFLSTPSVATSLPNKNQ